MSRATVEKVPQVQEKLSLLMWELMDVALGEGSCRWEKLCTARYMPGFDVFGTKDSREDWKGPRASSNWFRVNGPMYRPDVNSLSMILLYTLVSD